LGTRSPARRARPCASPGSGTAPQPTPTRPPALFHGKCQRGRLPDRHCTPGKVATTDVNRICTPGYTKRVRNVSDSTKNRVYFNYGIRRHSPGQYEIDHLVPLELGGSNSIKNLFPEAAKSVPGFHQKDRLENRFHQKVCDGEMSLRTAQSKMAHNWYAAYKREFG